MLCAGVRTDVASVVPDLVVDTVNMLLQISPLRALVVTDMASVVLDLVVNSVDVLLEVSLLEAGVVTGGTDVVLHLVVHALDVSPEVGLLAAAVVTQVALVEHVLVDAVVTARGEQLLADLPSQRFVGQNSFEALHLVSLAFVFPLGFLCRFDVTSIW